MYIAYTQFACGECMIINGIQFNCELSDVLPELKSQLAINGIQLFAKMFDSGDNYMICCPYHKNGQERRPSCGIKKSDGTVHCLACDKVVGLDEMIANCFGYNDPAWGYRWLVQNFATVRVEDRKEIELDLTRSDRHTIIAPNFVPESELDTYRYNHPYMYERGLTDEIIELFDIGYDKARDEITFPVRDWHSNNFGKTMFIARRSIRTKRFDLPKDMEKPLYGLFEIWLDIQMGAFSKGRGQNATIKPVGEVYVCEGLFDCLRLWCNGKYAVAGFGCLFSEYQLQLLKGLPTRKLVLALDNDRAGREATTKIRKAIKNKIITEVVIPKGRKDIGECSDKEIQELEEVF